MPQKRVTNSDQLLDWSVRCSIIVFGKEINHERVASSIIGGQFLGGVVLVFCYR